MAKKEASSKPQLKLCAAAWTLRNYPSAEKEWSIETKIKRVKEAGFDGFSSGAEPAIAEACVKYGLTLIGGVDVGKAVEAEPKLQAFRDLGVKHVNVQLCDHDTPTAKSMPIARMVMEAGKNMGIQPAIEWHRDTCTETPEKALDLADAYQKRYKEKLRMNFDHSHPAIIKQLAPAHFWLRLSERRLDLFKMSELIHFRTFTGSHCQTPITNGRGKLDADFMAWRDNFLRPALGAWLAGARAGKTLYAVVELGPKGSGYALDCFPDVWKDAIVARGEIERVWMGRLRGWGK